MAQDNKNPRNLSEAIEELEKFASAKSSDLQDSLRQELDEIKRTIEELKPQYERIKSALSEEASEVKKKAEDKVRDNPLAVVGVVALIAFLIGWVLGHRRSD